MLKWALSQAGQLLGQRPKALSLLTIRDLLRDSVFEAALLSAPAPVRAALVHGWITDDLDTPHLPHLPLAIHLIRSRLHTRSRIRGISSLWVLC